MHRQKKLFSETKYKLYAPDSLEKNWFVYWYEGTRRQRKYGDINQHKTKEERMAAAQQLIAQLKEAARPAVSVAEEKARAFLEKNQGRWRQKTREQYTSIVNVLFEWLAGRELSRQTVADFLAHIANTRHATTYNKYRQKVKSLLVRSGIGDLTQGTERMKAHSVPARYFQRHQVERLKGWMQEHDPELWLFVQFVYYCFIRPGELRHVRVGDILYDEAQIIVRAEVSKNRKQQYVVLPDAFLREVQHFLHLPPARLLFPSGRDASKPIGINSMYRRHQRALEALGFGAGYTLYSWKHTGSVAAAKAGVSVKELQLQLRHHSLDETDRYLRQMGVRDMERLRAEFPEI
jgi:integrase